MTDDSDKGQSGTRRTPGRKIQKSARPRPSGVRAAAKPSPAQPAGARPIRILVVDDEPSLLRAYTRALSGEDFEIELARNGQSACELLASQDFDVIVSDVCMPKLDGLGLLKAVRARDLDVPVILITASPSVETAMQAVEYGALKYLLKPIPDTELRTTVRDAAQLHELARLERKALELLQLKGRYLGDRSTLELHFDHALDGLWVAYQPIVLWSERRVVAFEALARTREGALNGPADLLDAAERLDRLNDLGRTVRSRVTEAARSMPDETSLFVNLHPRDLFDGTLTDPDDDFAQIADRVVLEVTERAALGDLGDVVTRVSALEAQGYRIAVDDLGAGYAGLSSFAQLAPTVVKLDMSLIRGVDQQPVKQRLVRSMTRLCSEMGTLVIVEGVETAAERDTLVECGCDHMQGFLFGRPAPTPEAPPGFNWRTRAVRA